MAETTQARIDGWMKTAVPRKMNPDKVLGLQCVDVWNDYAQTLYAVSWVKVCGTGNASSAFSRAPIEYWQKIQNNPKDANLIPKRGDVVCYPGKLANAWLGHIGVVEKADKAGVWIYQQDGFLQKPTNLIYIPYRNYLPQGWLRPRVKASAPKPEYVTVKAGWGLSNVALAAGYSDYAKDTRWTAIAKLNGSSDWKKFNKALKVGQKVRVR